AALAVYFADVGTDIWLAVDYYLRGQRWWFGLTLFFVLLGSLSVQAFVVHLPFISTTWAFLKLPLYGLYLLRSYLYRYFHTIYLGIRSRRSGENDRWRFYWKMVYEYADVSMLHLLATFLESAPQLVLQLCIVVQTRTLQALQGRGSFNLFASLVSLAWALASYQKALRDSRDDKKPISYMAVIIQFCWHFFTIAARVITFALFASVFQLYFGIFIVLHWCIMTFWIVHCETEFCITKWEEIVFDMVVGIIYIFSWFNVKEGRTRCRLFIYYFVILLENTALSALWYLYKAPPISDAFAIPALCVVFSSFLTGIVFMLMYYAFFHPNGPRFGQSPSCACEDAAAAFTLPPEVATNTLRSISNNRRLSTLASSAFILEMNG
uniref:XK-related protein n=1 Tax=Buteo japonicus TaxID=224669 RepID=A0A8C0B968_9AVES